MWLQAKLPGMKVRTMLKNWPDEEITMTGIAAATPPHPTLEETAAIAITTGEWLPPSNATYFCSLLHPPNAKFPKEPFSSACSLLNQRFIGLHLMEKDLCLIPGCKGDWKLRPKLLSWGSGM